MKITNKMTVAWLIGFVCASGAGVAQTWQPPAEIAPAKPTVAAPPPSAAAPVAATPAKSTASAKDKAAKAKECKAQSAAKGLRGEERKKFTQECIKS